MTATVEQSAHNSLRDAAGAAAKPGLRAPHHCGQAMQLAAWEAIHPEWVCGCGFRLDSGPAARNSGRILATAGEVERLQWELDRAQEDLRAAILAGAADGMDVQALAFAAGATMPEIRRTLSLPVRA